MSYKMSVDLSYVEKKSRSVPPNERYGVNMGNFNNPADPYASQQNNQNFNRGQPPSSSSSPPNVPINTTFSSPNDRPVVVWLSQDEYTLVNKLGQYIIQSMGGLNVPDKQSGRVHFKNGSMEEIVKLFALSHYNRIMIEARAAAQRDQIQQGGNYQNQDPNQNPNQVPRKTYHNYGRPQQ
jgi:hypothetical protein